MKKLTLLLLAGFCCGLAVVNTATLTIGYIVLFSLVVIRNIKPEYS